ncbi:NAD(P)-dependent oxidoreductase [Brachybacterium sp.]|uniref:NAD(P)-dependent oxidoreductase n=1 Tax=Brachybacterium sp. TaxID=1891286 RepID=UPI002ED5FBCA
MRIGFIGLGVMGAPMAKNLLDAGHELRIHRENARSQGLVDAGATLAPTPSAAAEGAEVVLLMLPDTPDVEAVLQGPDGVLSALADGTLVIDMSSISPVVTERLAAEVADAGGQYVDAPVSGGEVGAQEGTLTIFVGGQEAAVERARPLLGILGGRITHLGPAGAGQAAKVVNQIIVGLTIEAVAEGLALAEASGLDPEQVRSALDGGFATSRILEIHGRRMADRTFEPGFRVRLHRKDLRLAQDAAAHRGLALPGLETVAGQMDEALSRQWEDLDHSALFRLLVEEG